MENITSHNKKLQCRVVPGQNDVFKDWTSAMVFLLCCSQSTLDSHSACVFTVIKWLPQLQESEFTLSNNTRSIFRLFTKYFWFSFQAHDRISLPYPLEVTGGFLHPGNRSRSDVCHLWTDTLRSSVLTHHISFSCGGDCGSSCQDGSLNDYKDSAVNVYWTHTWSVK